MRPVEILTKKVIPKYLKKVGTQLDFKITKITKIEEITSYSNANYLFKTRVITNRGVKNLILKQAHRYNKRALKQGKKIFVHQDRILGEAAMLELLKKLWGQQFVPQILYFDRQKRIIIMSDVGQGKLLIQEFNRNRVYPQLGQLLGQLFAKLHGSTYGAKKEFSGSLSWKKRLIKVLIYDYWSQGLKKFFPAQQVNQFLETAIKAKPSAVWADPVYRNIFVKKNSVTFFDFDHTCTYDPAFDNGVLLAHWAWMMLKGNQKVKKDSEKFVKDYIKAYKKTMISYDQVKAKDLREILSRSVDWMALYLVSRTDGKSGSYFKDWPAWEKRIRQVGIDLFINNSRNLEAKKIKQLILN